jgi:hypothetical protein
MSSGASGAGLPAVARMTVTKPRLLTTIDATAGGTSMANIPLASLITDATSLPFAHAVTSAPGTVAGGSSATTRPLMRVIAGAWTG